jgi:iron complex outermembrane receptor protein
LQLRHVSYQANGFRNNPDISFDEQWTFLNPKAGITYHNNSLTAYASYAMANKEPNRDDFEAGALETPRREQLHNVELGIERKNVVPGLQLSANAYMMYYRDQLVLTGKINDVGAYTRTNIPESYRAGLELEARYARPKVSLAYSLALSQNRIIHYTGYYDDYDNGGQITVAYGNTPIALSPGVVQNATLEWRPVQRVELALLSKYVGRQYLDNAGQKERSLNPFFVNDIRATYQVPVRNRIKSMRVVLQVNNVTNRMYEPNGYTFSYQAGGQFVTENFFYPMAGINYMAALEIGL